MIESVIIVIGMHRSGTSALCGLLSNHGYNFGSRLLKPSKYNAQGYFENQNIVRLNEEILNGSNCSWDVPYFVKSPIESTYVNFEEQLDSILAEDYNNSSCIALKDPRISVLIPWYKLYFEKKGVEVAFICALRHPYSIASSLKRRNGFSREKSLGLWSFYMSRILKDVTGELLFIVEFENLLKTPQAKIESLVRELEKIGFLGSNEVKSTTFKLDQGLVHNTVINVGKENSVELKSYRAIQALISDDLKVHEVNGLPSINFPAIEEISADLRANATFGYSQVVIKSRSGKYIEPLRHLIDSRVQSHKLEFDLDEQSQIETLHWNPLIGSWLELKLLNASYLNANNDASRAKVKEVNGAQLEENSWRFETGNAIVTFINPEGFSAVKLVVEFGLKVFSLEDIELGFHKKSREYRAHIEHLNAEIGDKRSIEERVELIESELLAAKEHGSALLERIDLHDKLKNRIESRLEKSTKLNHSLLDQMESLLQQRMALQGELETQSREGEQREKLLLEFKSLNEALESYIRTLQDHLIEKESEIELGKKKDEELRDNLESALSKLREENFDVVTQVSKKLNLIGIEKNSLQQELEISKANIRRLDYETKALTSSLSYGLGRFLTWPFRVIFEYLNGVKLFQAAFVIIKMGLLALSKPIRLISSLNFKNFKILFLALRDENSSDLQRNFKEKLGISVSDSNDDHQSIHHSDNDRVLVHIEGRKVNRNHISVTGWVRAKDPIVSITLQNQDGLIIGDSEPKIYRPDVILAQGNYDFPALPGFEIGASLDEDCSEVRLNFYGPNREEFYSVTWPIDQHTSNKKMDPYQVWLRNNEISSKLTSRLKTVQSNFVLNPLFSIVMPIYNVDPKWVDLAIESIRNQIYSNWELILVNDASDRVDLNLFLDIQEKSSDQIKLITREVNGNISAATNDGIRNSKGDFIVFMDQDDKIAKNALFEYAFALNTIPSLDLIYSDEDKIDEHGRRYDPWFKPDWSPELLLSYNYINHLSCVRKEIAFEAGLLRSEMDGCQDFDFLLRAAPLCSGIYHVPKVLYHWRALETSIAGQGAAKNIEFDFFNKGKFALESYLEANKITFSSVFRTERAKKLNAAFYSIEFPDLGDLVSIIIPSKNHRDILKKCIDSLEKTSYANYEIIIADNASDDAKTLKYLKSLESNPKIKAVRIENRQERFSFSQINNDAVQHAQGKYLIFLNDDTEVISSKWLSSLIGYLKIPGVGAAGAQLLYPDDTIQHAGVLLNTYPHGYKNLPDHAFKNHNSAHSSYGFYTDVSRNYSAVTAACIGVSRELFLEVGGFDEKNLKLAYNDIDFCLKLTEMNRRVVYVPEACLYHHESKSRGNYLNIREVVHYKNQWRDQKDVYYNINLSDTKPYEVSTYNTQLKNLPHCNVNVVFLSHNLNLEGAPLQLLEIIQGLQKKNWNLSVVSPYDGPLKMRYVETGIKVHILSPEQSVDSLLHELTPDVLVANTLVSYNYILAADRLGIPSTWIIHESSHPKDFFSDLPVDELERVNYSMKCPYTLIFVAKATEVLFSDYNIMHNHCVINNGLKTDAIFDFIRSQNKKELRAKLGFRNDELVILNLGTVCKRKGQLDFVKSAISLLDGGDKNLRFVIVGARRRNAELKYLESILELIDQSGHTSNFDIIDETPETFQYFMSADVFVCSSYNESYPRVILEAMAFSLPIISTPVFGITEQIIEKQNCEYFAPGDVATLADKLELLITDSNVRMVYGENSRAMLELITSYEEMVKEYSNKIEEAIFTELN